MAVHGKDVPTKPKLFVLIIVDKSCDLWLCPYFFSFLTLCLDKSSKKTRYVFKAKILN